jgi:hypothetical protein
LHQNKLFTLVANGYDLAAFLVEIVEARIKLNAISALEVCPGGFDGSRLTPGLDSPRAIGKLAPHIFS